MRRFVRWAMAAGTFLAPLTAHADTQGDLEGLLNESVVQGASQTAETTRDAPATVSTLTADDMRRFGIRSLSDAVNFLGMGLITQDPLHAVEIGGRGVLLTGDYGNHVLVLVDGHAVNEQWDGSAYVEQGLGMPIELIDHIELILGPGSVLYGGSAMLGVIHVVTKTASNYKGVHVIAEGGVSPRQDHGRIKAFAPGDGYTYRVGAGAGLDTELFGRPLGVVAQIEMYAQNGPSFSWGPQAVTRDDGTPVNFGPRTPPGLWGGITREQYYTLVPAGYLRAVYGEFALSVHAETYKRATPVPGFNQTYSNFDESRSYELDRWLWADLTYAHQFDKHFSVKARAYGDTYDYRYRALVSDPSYCSSRVSGDCLSDVFGASRWGGVEVQGAQDWLGNDRLTTRLGADVRLRFIRARSNVTDTSTGTSDGSPTNDSATEMPVGVYLQQRWTPWTPLHINAGARFDLDPRGGNHLSPRAAAAVDVWKGGVLKSVYSEAFRAPTYYEYYYSEAEQLPNPSLKAETVRSMEASIEQRVGAHRLLFGVFRSWWHDMVQYQLVDPANGVYQFQNASTIDNYGFNGAVDGIRGPFRYGVSMTGAYTRRNSDAGTVPLAVAPQVFGNARVAYDLPGDWPTIALATSLIGPRLADRALDGGFPVMPVAPTNLQVRLTFSGAVPFASGLSYRLSGNYQTASVSPYVAGPNQTVGADGGPAELTPINRATVFATLQYDLGGNDR